MEENNAAAMREALLAARYCLDNLRTVSAYTVDDTLDKVDAALAAPPRNCDVGTAEEIDARWNAYCAKRIKRENCMSNKNCKGCAWRWAQMPYEEGVAKR